MQIVKLTLLDPKDFEVVKVISFTDSHLKVDGTVVYRRPLTTSYNKNCPDDFDNSLVAWLKQLNLKNVNILRSEDILFHNQLDDYKRIYDGGRPHTTLSLTCHGNYTNDELMKKGGLEARIIELPIFWNSLSPANLPIIGGVVTFDKSKEHFFFQTIPTIKAL